MKHKILWGMGLLCGLAIATSAASDATKSTKATKAITLTGCLQAGDGEGAFKLTNVTGGPAAKNPAATNKDWELMDAPSSLKMTDHVGHKVSVTGTVMGHGKSKEGGEEQGVREKGGPRHLQVQSFKHVAASCP